MQHDRKITVSVAGSRYSTNWQRAEYMWSEFIERLRTPQRTAETFEAYMQLSKAQQGTLKDIGGFVGGTLAGTQRKSSAVTGRDLVTLDLDNIAAGETEDVLRRLAGLGAAYAVYSTRSHAPYRPRMRAVLPLDRTVTADEYEPIARRLASVIGIEMCDPTTFEPARLMYWPGCSSDSAFVFACGDYPFCSADGILGQYEDWRDVRSWPQVPGKEIKAKTLLAKQADPRTKPGVVGAFCRTYDIRGALEAYLPHAYDDTDHRDRLTYTGGTTVAGAVLYDDDTFLYSHHATDPCSGQLVNAFDLVRLHKFADEDAGAKEGTPTNKLPSYTAMRRLAMQDAAVMADLNAAAASEAADVFASVPEEAQDDAEEGVAECGTPNVDWIARVKLEYDQNTGKPRKTLDNIIKILEQDPGLKGKAAFNEFAAQLQALGALPWDTRAERRPWGDADDVGLMWYLEKRFGITGTEKIRQGLILVADRNKFHDVRDYLAGLSWDGRERLDTVLTDYLGAADSLYVRAAARKSFTAAVARVMRPGCKWDYVPVLIGKQGIGKTTFLREIGHGWYSDNLQTFSGKEAIETIQGVWINEIGEMTGYSKSENNVIKQFISRQFDSYRRPYGRNVEQYPRQGVFFGTCNEHDFLKDPTGNRRFWPISCGVIPPRKSIWDDLPGEVNQLWAEALARYHEGEKLHLDEITGKAAQEAQEQHRERSAWEGKIEAFLLRPVPVNYDALELPARRMYWSGSASGVETVPRDKVCAAEIWCECLNRDIADIKRKDAVEINNILASLPGWKRTDNSRRFGTHGKQRGFEREA